MSQTHNASEAEARETAEAARQKQWEAPSFMKELFLGTLRMDLLFPFPDVDTPDRPEYLEYREGLRQYLLDEIDPLEIDATGEFPEDIVERLTEIGALGMNISKDYGGLGLSKYEYCRTMQLSNSYEGSLMGFLSPHQSVGVPETVKLFGTQEQKDHFLRRCADGAVSAFALTEPDVGSDPARVASSLRTSDDGKHYFLNGTKLWCTNGTCCELLVVLARHDESGKISAVIVEMDWEGVHVDHRCRFMGLSALQNGVIRFDNVKVPIGNRISKEGAGLRIALTALNTGRLSIPFGATGAAKKCLEVSRNWAAERTQWGKRIGDHEAIGQKIASMAAHIYAMETIITLACRLTDKGGYDLRLESAACKEWNTSRCWDILDDTMQIRGGRGYEKETSLRDRGERAIPCERLMRDQRISRIFEGASEIMHLLMAREAVDKHLEIAGTMVDPKATLGAKVAALPKIAAFYGRWYPATFLGFKGRFGYGEFGDLAGHLRFVDRSARKLARQAFHGMIVHGPGLEQRQAFLFRWVDIAMELFAMAASVSRAKSMQDCNDAHAAEATELADAFCKLSRQKVRRLFKDLWNNADKAARTTAQHTLDGRYAWLEEGIVTQDETDAAMAKRNAAPPSEDDLKVPAEEAALR